MKVTTASGEVRYCWCDKPCSCHEEHICKLRQAIGKHGTGCEWCRRRRGA